MLSGPLLCRPSNPDDFLRQDGGSILQFRSDLQSAERRRACLQIRLKRVDEVPRSPQHYQGGAAVVIVDDAVVGDCHIVVVVVIVDADMFSLRSRWVG